MVDNVKGFRKVNKEAANITIIFKKPGNMVHKEC